MTSERAKWLCLVPAVTIMAVAVIAVVLTRAVEQQAIDFAEPENQPYRPARIELFQPASRFEIVGTDVTPGAQLHWVLVARKARNVRDNMTFRVLLGDSFGPIERGRVVRLGKLHFWQNPGYEANTLVVLAIE